MQVSLKVEGMSCQHCVRSIQQQLGKMNGVQSVMVNLDSKTVVVEYDQNQTQLQAIKEVIDDLGYTVA